MKKRESNFELLKIVLIIMVIALHYFNAEKGGGLGNVNKGTLNFYIMHLGESACIVSVNAFVIITGYFSCKKEEINISKVIKLFSLTIFYAIFFYLIVILFNKVSISFETIKEFIFNCFNYWFLVIYCILYLLIPYINKLISSLTERQLKNLLIINILFFYLWPTVFTGVTLIDGGYGIVNFINLYLIGAYIRLYRNQNIKKRYSLLIYILCTIITFFISLFFRGRAWKYVSIVNLIGSIALFEIFKSIKLDENKFINALASYTFAIFTIHVNTFITQWLYRELFHSKEYWNDSKMILNLIISIVGIYIFCTIIEFFRRLLFKKLIDDNIDKIKWKISCKKENL